jgi:hypothetical protein
MFSILWRSDAWECSTNRTLTRDSADEVPEMLGQFSWRSLDGDDFEFGIDLLFQHALNRHQCAR